MVGEIPVTKGQLKFEFNHLLGRPKVRDERKFEELKREATDYIEPWERGRYKI